MDITEEYVTKFKNSSHVNLDTPYIDIYFPLETTIQPFEQKQRNSSYNVGESALTYPELSRFIFDLYSQILYFMEQGYHFREIRTSSIWIVEEKHMIFDMEVLKSGSKDDELKTETHQMFLRFIQDFIGKKNLHCIEGTPLEHFIRRIENENVMLWVHTL